MSSKLVRRPTSAGAEPPRPCVEAYETLPSDRVELALQAGYELETLADAMLGGFNVDDECQKYMRRATAVRVRDLARVVMSALDDDVCTTAKLHAIVHGTRPPKDG